ncbi:MAG: hypothetical protein IQL11_08405, partial [Bacteroidales bacterium]|nr:hypothetical protein [Bacteroidales bacterium]
PRGTEPLKGIIDKLHKEGKVPSHITTSMDHLNSLSTFGTHPKDFDPEQVKPVLNNLTIIIKWYLNYKRLGKDINPKPSDGISQEVQSTEGLKKNIQIPKKRLIGLLNTIIVLCAIVVALLYFSKIIGGSKQTKEIEKCIAVLPFLNYSGDPTQEFMCEGLTDEIINHLFKIKSFDKVVPLSSVLTYKGTNKRHRQIADELKVNYILEGSYKKIDDQVKVIAHLIEPKNDRTLWLHEYDTLYKEIIAIQADIALKIADHLKAFLSGFEKLNIQKIPTTNQEAYNKLQQAKIYFYVGPQSSHLPGQFLGECKNLALKAVELDPNYADAYAWAGLFSLWTGGFSGDKEISVAAMDALPFIEKALELDQNNSLAHYVMANINEWNQWDYIKAEKEYLKVFELAPNQSEHYSTIGEFFLKMNQLDKAIFFLQKAFESELINPTTVFLRTLILSGNKIEAVSTIGEYLKSQLKPDYPRVGECFIWMEEYDSARFYLETALKYDVPAMSVPRFQACLAFVYSKTNNHDQGQIIINQLIKNSKITSARSPDFFIGWYYSRIGEVDSAFYWLEKACISRSPEMPWLKVDPAFKYLNNDYRYWDLYNRTGHKAYDDYRASLKE